VRRTNRPSGGRRDRSRTARARETQAAQRQAGSKKISPTAYRRRRILGWTLVVLAIVVGVSHWMEHLGMFSFASEGIEDLVAGYPLAGVLGIASVIVLSK